MFPNFKSRETQNGVEHSEGRHNKIDDSRQQQGSNNSDKTEEKTCQKNSRTVTLHEKWRYSFRRKKRLRMDAHDKFIFIEFICLT